MLSLERASLNFPSTLTLLLSKPISSSVSLLFVLLRIFLLKTNLKAHSSGLLSLGSSIPPGKLTSP